MLNGDRASGCLQNGFVKLHKGAKMGRDWVAILKLTSSFILSQTVERLHPPIRWGSY
jgi:hypothetical protein